MLSLGEGWETFSLAKGDWIRRVSVAELHSEIRAMDARKAKPAIQPVQPDTAKALSSRFGSEFNEYGKRRYFNGYGGGDNDWHEGDRGNGFHGRGRGNFRGRGGRGRGGKAGRQDRKSSYDPDKYCRYCQKIGHDVHVCRKYARDQQEWKKDKKRKRDDDDKNAGSGSSTRTDFQPSFVPPLYHYSANTLHMIATVTRFIANSSELTTPSNNWIVDSAANAYITPYKSDLRFFVERLIGEVKGFGGKTQMALGTDSVTLTDATGSRITLKDVCYVPGSEDRILSLMKFRREHKTDFQFTGPETFSMTAANGFKLIGNSVNDILYATIPHIQANVTANVAVTRGSAKRQFVEDTDSASAISEASELERPFRKRLRLNSDSPPPSSPLACSPADLWHLRFGHASTTALRKLKQIKSIFDSAKCIPCLRAKKIRKPFHASKRKVTQQLERVHSDICGQFPESEGNSIYNLTFLDEATQYAYAISIPDKSSETVKKAFTDWIVKVERETGRKVKRLRTDGGGEYQGELTPILTSLGIQHETTPPRTPELNGKAERLNRTLNDTIRAMLIQANMPDSFWAEAMATAVYLKNRLPSEAIDDDVSFQR